MTIKTRFAPSPTGFLHIGGARTALFNWIYARSQGGRFVLRIEDTDMERSKEEYLEEILKSMTWLGLEWDEFYKQSDRFELYRQYAQKLLDEGKAYADGPAVILKMPQMQLKFFDLIRGEVEFDSETIKDQVLIKSDGFPTYHLANVVDDHLMEITHVIRGEEWLPSTPKHIFLYNAFGWKAPEFAHIPLLLNNDRTKLSKRQGDVAVEDYIQKGYIKEAIINFAAFLGWHPGAGEETEIFSLTELEQKFSLDRVHKAGAIFNIEKLDWYNWQWQKRIFNEKMQTIAKEIDTNVEINQPKPGVFTYTFTSNENQEKFREEKAKNLREICEKYIAEELLKKDEKLLNKALILNEEKIIKEPKTITENITYFFELPTYDKILLTNAKMNVDEELAKSSIQKATEVLDQITEKDWTEENLKEKLLTLIQSLNLKNGQVLWPLRAALTGQEFSPGVFEMLWALGKEESLSRLKKTAI